MIKTVVDNTTPEARQLQLEAKVQVAFARVAGSMLRFLTGQSTGDMVTAMKEFVEVYEAAFEESIDPKGIAIRVPKLDPEDNEENEHINALLRGSLRMVAAMLASHAETPYPDQPDYTTKSAAYDAALDEITEGIEKQMNARALKQKRPNPKRKKT